MCHECKSEANITVGRTLAQTIVMIEEMTGEKVTPEEIEELSHIFDGLEQDSSHGTRH